MMRSFVKKLLPCIATLLAISSVPCAANAAQHAINTPRYAADIQIENDPLEPFNRAMFDFNYTVDSYLLRPVAKGYRYITPEVVRTHVGNFTDNLYEPVNAVNALLQGDIQQGMTSFWRFVLNSTVGLAGLNDVATEAGLARRSEDFGQTLAVWGVDAGPYVVLPLLGPSNLRDTVGVVADFYTNPIFYYAVDDTGTSLAISAGRGIVQRERYLEALDDIYASSLDPYVSFRSIYAQRRKAQIANRYGKQSPPRQ